ncbi:MAG TPA: hypothetical protein VNX68_03820, partial [Nitrosopumilaceae archaeon]|nr:hypothetical protein [Nitrosopumilaceae archaeon]
HILISHESHNLKKTVRHDLFIYKDKRLQQLLKEQHELLKSATDHEEVSERLVGIRSLVELKKKVNKLLGRTIVK